MRINFIQNHLYYNQPNPNSSPTFSAQGKPLTLKYIVEKRSNLLPARVLENVKKCLLTPTPESKSLLALHRETYAPLLECKTLDEVKSLYPEFKDIKDEIIFKRPNSTYAKSFTERIQNENFALKMLQEIYYLLRLLYF